MRQQRRTAARVHSCTRAGEQQPARNIGQRVGPLRRARQHQGQRGAAPWTLASGVRKEGGTSVSLLEECGE